jgi:hypothetical protein
MRKWHHMLPRYRKNGKEEKAVMVVFFSPNEDKSEYDSLHAVIAS